MLDYIVVGAGLSGIAVSENLISLGKNIRVFENRSQSSSTVAGGIFNPVILKRFTLAWKADEQLKAAIPFYKGLEEKLNVKLVHNLPVYRRFNSVEEQNNWFEAMDKPSVAPFLDEKLVTSLNPNIQSQFSFGQVREAGTIDTELLLNEYRAYLAGRDQIVFEDFKYNEVKVLKSSVSYRDIEAKKIIFCEGFGLKNNKFFSYLPLQGNKGEYIIIRSKDLKLEVAVKSSVFILPLGNGLYKVGATYDNNDKTQEPTEKSKNELLGHLRRMITCSFELVDQVAGIRPSTRDRRPLAGRHPELEQLYCCNGFGSRGVLIAPPLAEEVVNLCENGIPLSAETDLKRFDKYYPGGLR